MRYEIEGNNLPVVICHLEEGEKIITEQGAMAWMTPNMKWKQIRMVSEEQSQGLFRANLFFKTFIIHVEVEERV